MSVISNQSKFVGPIKKGSLLYCPVISRGKDDNKPYVRFIVFRFIKFTIMQEGSDPQIEGVQKSIEEAPIIAQLQMLGEIDYNAIYEQEEYNKLDKIIAEKEEVKKESTYIYRSIEFGMYDNPLIALRSFYEQLTSIAGDLKEAIDLFPQEKSVQ